MELIKSLVPQAKIEIVPGVGHFTMTEAADVVDRRIEAVLKKNRQTLN